MADPESTAVARPADAATAGGGESELELDQIFETLKNERRRLVLHYLRAVDSGVSLSELSEAIAAMENGKHVDETTSQERKRVYVGLYQCHLPMMDRTGIVDFEKSRGEVALGVHATKLFPYLERSGAVATATRWHLAYVGLSIGGLLLLGMVLLAELFGGVSAAMPALAVVVVSFTLLSVAHARSTGTGTGREQLPAEIPDIHSTESSSKTP